MEQSPSRTQISTIRVGARGEQFTVLQVLGNLIVCSRENGSCCCGWAEKDRMPFDNTLWSDEWERRGIRHQLHLTFSGCLGPCIAGNNALVVLFGQPIWFKDLNRPDLIPAVYDYLQAMLAAGGTLPPPPELVDHVYDRYLADDDAVERGDAEADGLATLDPVCLMQVDPATAVHTAEYRGRVVLFCAPSCRKQFLANPESFAATIGL